MSPGFQQIIESPSPSLTDETEGHQIIKSYEYMSENCWAIISDTDTFIL